MNNFEQYHKAVDFLEGLTNLPLNGDYMIKQRHLGVYLKRMRYFLNLLGNPDKNMKFIHITGTAGKGSVTNMIHEVLMVSGKNVGSFTSPFVTTSIEKIKVGDKYINPNELANIVESIKPLIDKAYMEGPYGRPSYFEIFLAIALIYFKKQKCEWVVLEVGLGGRYDATNVIEKPTITAITNIDYDHTELLGKTLKQIAYDKVGIIKKGSNFFTTEQRPTLTKMFAEICKEKGASFHQLPKQPTYQESNKILARAISKSIGIKDVAIQNGIKNARLQCRFETMQNKPLVILDGAHNRSKIRSAVENIGKIKFNKLYLIVGLAENKDSASILEQIVPLADHIVVTRFQVKDRKCAHPKKLLDRAGRYMKKGTKIEMFLDPQKALAQALKKAKHEDAVLVVGSFFLAGEMRKRWFPESVILKNRASF